MKNITIIVKRKHEKYFDGIKICCNLVSITTDLKIRSKWVYTFFSFPYLYSQCQRVIRLDRWSVVIPLSPLAFLFPHLYLITSK